MPREESSQLELFAHPAVKSANTTQKTIPGPLGGFVAHYERNVLIIICFIVTGIVSFSLGVERGKRLASVKLNSRFDTALKIQPPQDTQQIPKPAIEKPQIIIPQQPKENIQGYTIQVATYQTKTYARQEANNLKKKGFLAVVIPKGVHTILCVGNFTDKGAARALLAQLKKRYRDCFIRRL